MINNIIDEVFPCSCGIHLIRIRKFESGEDSDTFISFYEDAYYASQDSRIKLYFKRLWSALRGKRYLLFEVALTSGDVTKLSETLERADAWNHEDELPKLSDLKGIWKDTPEEDE